MAALSQLRRHLREPELRRRWFLALYALALTSQPLVGTLGYENAVALTPPMALLGVFVGVDAVRGAGGPGLDAIARRAARDLLALAGTALAVLVVAQLWHPSCDPGRGLVFLALGPLISGALGAVSGIVGAVIIQRPPRRWLQALAGLAAPLYCLVVGLLRLYLDPAVYAFDPFWGYFAGPLYDEAIAIDDRYLLFRTYNLLAAAAALAAVRLWGERILAREAQLPALTRLRLHPWAGALLCLGLAGSAWLGLQPARYGFHATVDGIAEVLPATRLSEHFIVHYAPTSETAREIEVVMGELEFAHFRLRETLGRAPQGRVEVFVFPNPQLKRRTVGAATTEVAPPWRLQLYLNHQPFPAPVMPHELAHAFESTIGDRVFGVSGALDRRGLRLNLALVEGVATALAPRSRDGLDLHDTAAVLDRLGLRPDLGDIMGVAFWGQASRRAYTAAGSFCLWLLETRGAGPLIALYGSAGDFEASYGEHLVDLEAEWLAFLRARELRPQDVEAMRQLFERRSIFQRPCAHRAADLAQEAAEAQARGDVDAGLQALESLCAIEPEQPEHAIALATALASADRLADADQLLHAALGSASLTSTLRALVDERLGDLALIRGDLKGAGEHLRDALGRATSEAQTRTLQVKLLAADDPVLSPYLRDYFMPFESAAMRPTVPLRRLYAARRIAELPTYAPLGDYLTGLVLLGIEDAVGGIVHLERSLQPRRGALPLHSIELVRSARIHLVNALVRERRYDRAEELLGLLEGEPGIGNGHRHTYSEWRARIAFFRTYLPAPIPLPPLGLPVIPDDEGDDAEGDDQGGEDEVAAAATDGTFDVAGAPIVAPPADDPSATHDVAGAPITAPAPARPDGSP
ncbi:MAG: hypothetical protein H6711_06970 [Myxococcales bacterium]|nr:hypothetical protein [Myxococcales bacterium]